MCRYMQAEQFIGATFKKLVELDKQYISWPELSKLGKEVDDSIRENNKAILYASMNEMYTVFEDYQKFFQPNGNQIKVHDDIWKTISSNNKKKSEFVNTLSEYFTNGMPKDIDKTVSLKINNFVRIALEK